MSSSTATTVRARIEPTRSGSEPLRLVRREPRESGRLPFALLIIFLVAAGLVGLLLVNTSLQSGAFEAGRLQQDNQLLAEQQGDLQRQVQQLSSPGEVTRRASALGMVPDPNPGFLRLSDGKVLGDPQPAARTSSGKHQDGKKDQHTKKQPSTTTPATTKTPAAGTKTGAGKKPAAGTKPATSQKPGTTTKKQGTPSGRNR
jgi:hypothetical protein